MTGVEDVVGSLGANADAAQEGLAQVVAVEALVEAIEGQLAGLQLGAKAAAAGACKSQLAECAAMATGLVDGLNATRVAAEGLRGA
jgi:hypothetical protein